MTDDSTDRTRRAVLSGFAATLAGASVVGAQETTTTTGETTTAGETTTGVGTTTRRETTAAGEATTFRARIENISPEDALMPEGEPEPVILSPGVYAVHTERNPLFTPGEPDRGEGLEALAEDGIPRELADSLADREGVSASDAFDTSAQFGDPGPIGPGEAYEFEFPARRGDALSFATMFVPSNDLFFAPRPAGVQLFRGGDPISGEVTDQVALWDAGTEVNEEPGVGENQVQNQAEPDTGPDENAPVRRIQSVDDGFEYPNVSAVLRVTVGPADELETVTTIETTEEGAELVVGTTTEAGTRTTTEVGTETTTSG